MSAGDRKEDEFISMVKKLQTESLKHHHLKNDMATSILMHSKVDKYSRTVFIPVNYLLLQEQINA